MVYRASGAFFHSSGLSIAFAEFHENAGAWNFELQANFLYPSGASSSFINKFIEEHALHYKLALITVHSDSPTLQFNGAVIAAETGLPVITDLPALDIALGGNGFFFTSAALKLQIKEAEMDEINKAICVAFMGVLRWREEYNFISSVTGASRNSIGGAVWLGQEA